MTEIKLKTCPMCGRLASPKTAPFCSVRCADVDLGRWLTGSYVIPVADDEIDDAEEADDSRPDLPGHGRTG